VAHCIIVGADVHVKSILVKAAAYVDDHLVALSAHPRHAAAVEAMDAGYKGVGLKVALTWRAGRSGSGGHGCWWSTRRRLWATCSTMR